jgi:hypothetical protein
MDNQRISPIPSYPASLNKFYIESHKPWKETGKVACETHLHRLNLSKKIRFRKRFPKLNLATVSCESSPVRAIRKYSSSTVQALSRTRTLTPLPTLKAFKPISPSKARHILDRRVNGLQEKFYIKHKSINKTLGNKESKPFKFGKYINSGTLFLNSLNTYQKYQKIFEINQNS